MYEGEWVYGIQHGYGRMVQPNGVQKEGYFENNIYKDPTLAIITPGDKKRHRSSVLMNNYQQMMSTKANSKGFQTDD